MSEPQRPSRVATVDAIATSNVRDASDIWSRHVTPVVVDASAVIADLLYRLPLNAAERPSSLIRAAEIGSARLYAKLDALDEIVRRIPAIAANETRDATRMLELVSSDYVPWIRLVDTTGITVDDPRVRAVATRDPTDTDTATLTVLLAPSLLLTTDGDLLDSGLGLFYEPGHVDPSWTFAAATLRDGGFRAEMQAGAQGLAIVGLLGGVGAVNLVKVAVRNPKFAVLAGAAALLGGWWAARAGHLAGLDDFVDGARAVFSEGAELIEAKARTSDLARRQLAENAVTHAGARTPVGELARLLSLAPAAPGLTLPEIQSLATPGVDVTALIRRYPAFVKVSRWRWALGSPAS